jgi:hypothetical protein
MAAIDDGYARSRNRSDGCWRNRTFDMAIVKDRLWPTAVVFAWPIGLLCCAPRKRSIRQTAND